HRRPVRVRAWLAMVSERQADREDGLMSGPSRGIHPVGQASREDRRRRRGGTQSWGGLRSAAGPRRLGGRRRDRDVGRVFGRGEVRREGLTPRAILERAIISPFLDAAWARRRGFGEWPDGATRSRLRSPSKLLRDAGTFRGCIAY